MTNDKFTAVMGLIVPDVVKLIADTYELDEMTAAAELYASEMYSLLEDEETKLWHFSPLTLFLMFDEEKKTGSFTIPEEV